jgi:hypothetical protein
MMRYCDTSAFATASADRINLLRGGSMMRYLRLRYGLRGTHVLVSEEAR